MTGNEDTKHPVGLVPAPTWEDGVKQERIIDIKAAIQRYNMENKNVPDEWFIEIGSLMSGRRHY